MFYRTGPVPGSALLYRIQTEMIMYVVTRLSRPSTYIIMGKREKEKERERVLPQVKDITWVNTADLVEKKLDIGQEVESGGVKRVQVMYKYETGKRMLVLTQPRDNSAFFRTNGVEEDSYTAIKTGVKTMLGRHVVKLYMDAENEYHSGFYDALIKIRNVVKKKLDKDTGLKNNVQIKGLYDLVDDEKNITGHALVAKLIESADGDTYTAAYTDDEQIDVNSIGRSIVRPALVFGYIVPDEDTKEYRISVSITQMYVKTNSLFPLRDRD